MMQSVPSYFTGVKCLNLSVFNHLQFWRLYCLPMSTMLKIIDPQKSGISPENGASPPVDYCH